MNVEQALKALEQVRSDMKRLSRLSLLHSDPKFFQDGKSTLGRVVDIKNQIAIIESYGKTASLHGKANFETGDWVRIEPESKQNLDNSSTKVLVRTLPESENSPKNQTNNHSNISTPSSSNMRNSNPSTHLVDTFSSTTSPNSGRFEGTRSFSEADLKLVGIRPTGGDVQPDQKIRLAVLDTKLPPFGIGEETLVRVLETIGQRSLVEIKGSQLIVNSSSNLTPGTEIMARILSLQPQVILESQIPLVGPGSVGAVGSDPRATQFGNVDATEMASYSIQRGQSLIAEVLGKEGSEWILEIAGQKSRFQMVPQNSGADFGNDKPLIGENIKTSYPAPLNFQSKELVPVRILTRPQNGLMTVQIEKKGFEQTIELRGLNTSPQKPSPAISPVRLEVISGRTPSLTIGETVSLRVEETGTTETTAWVKGSRITVQAPPGLEVGKQFSATVVRAGPHPVLETNNQELKDKSEPRFFNAVNTGRQNLMAGQVIKSFGENIFHLKSGLGVLEVVSPRQLEIGQELLFQADKIGLGSKLKVLDWGVLVEETAKSVIEEQLPQVQQPEKAFHHLKRAIEKAIAEIPSVGKDSVLGKMHQFIREVSSSPLDSSQIARLFHDGGLQYENKLLSLLSKDSLLDIEGDFKRLLMELVDLPAGSFSSQFGKVQEMADQYLRWLEVQQASNVLNALSGENFRLEIPFSVGSESIMAQLSFGPDSRSNPDDPEKRDQGTSVLFLLDLEGFGKTRIDAFVSKTQLSATLYIEQENALSLLRREVGSLYEAFKSDGFESINIDVKVLREMKEEELQEPKLIGPEAVRNRIRLINIEA